MLSVAFGSGDKNCFYSSNWPSDLRNATYEATAPVRPVPAMLELCAECSDALGRFMARQGAG